MSLIFKWKIKKVFIYPFGGYTLFDESINKPFKEEFLVFFGGILFQLIFSIIFSSLINNDTYIYHIFNSYNITILIFNMLPIIPLDGSKVLNIILNYIYPFKKSHLFSIYISYVIILILFIINYKNINMIIVLILVLFLSIKELKNHSFIFNSFLLERYLKNLKYKKINIINSSNIKQIKKYFKNIFIVNSNYYEEKDILKKRYRDID